MDKGYEKKYHEVEEQNWWFLSRRDAIVKILQSTGKDKKILDIGCAGGALIKDLTDKGFTVVHGLDFSNDAVNHCKAKGLENVFVMDAHSTSFDDETFDFLIASDSLEHLEHDETALLEWKRILKGNGKLIVFVPAYNFLWSDHDWVNQHFRRYSRKDLRKKITVAGFYIEKISFWNFSLFFPTAFLRIAQSLFINKNSTASKKDQIVKFNPFINQLLFSLLKFENNIFRIIGLPIGVSIYALARKPKKID
jgi:ubiquinone/menaquinone biosynthesis C-methylase UbiE